MNHWLFVTSPSNYGPCVEHRQWATMEADRLDPVKPGDAFVLYVKSGSGLTHSLSPNGTRSSKGLLVGAYGTVVGNRAVDSTPYWDRDYHHIIELDIQAVPRHLGDLRLVLGGGATTYGQSLQGDYLRLLSATEFELFVGTIEGGAVLVPSHEAAGPHARAPRVAVEKPHPRRSPEVGERAFHATYGRGTVIAIEGLRATVSFGDMAPVKRDLPLSELRYAE